MSTLLVRNSDIIITLDNKNLLITKGGIFVRDNIIEKIDKLENLPKDADIVIDATGMAILPGLINTHHHFYQTLTRAVPGSQDEKLFDWLVRLYPIWGELTDEAIYISTQTAMAEMILSGCTTSSDHHYLYPNNSTVDAQVLAAKNIGMRFHVTRGSMSLGRSEGGLPPDHVVEDEDDILEDCQRVIEKFHDPNPNSMVRVSLAPCSPFSVTGNLMKESAKLARQYKNVMLHTHVAETREEEIYCLREFGARPAEYMQQVDWIGPDVWWAHAVVLNDDDIRMMARTSTGVAHCPSANMRLGSGIARIRDMLDSGIKVGIGVDGSASNDSSHVINEVRTAMLLQRVARGADSFSVKEAIEIATKGGAAVLGRDDIGSLEVGKAADFIGINLNSLSLAGGAVHDPLAAILLCTIDKVSLSVINGQVIVQDGQIKSIDIVDLISRHNEIALEIVSRHPVIEKFNLLDHD